MADKVTVMILKVDLQCSSCYKKVKKVLCKFPQIRDQLYDVKQNMVTITVVCCNPEKIRDKLCCRGRNVIKSIEIKEPQKPKEPEKPKAEPEKSKPQPPTEKPVEKPTKEAPKVDKSKDPASTPTPTPPTPTYPGGVCCGPCYEGMGGGPCYHGYGRPVPPLPGEASKVDKPKNPAPAPAPTPTPTPTPTLAPTPTPTPRTPAYPGGVCCGPCYEGYGGGPCYHGYGRPVPPLLGSCYGGYGYRYGYSGNRSCCVSSDYFREENPQGCTIM